MCSGFYPPPVFFICFCAHCHIYSLLYLLRSLDIFAHLSRIVQANGIQKSLLLIVEFILSIFSILLGSAITDLLPSALAPNSSSRSTLQRSYRFLIPLLHCQYRISLLRTHFLIYFQLFFSLYCRIVLVLLDMRLEFVGNT